MSSIVILKKQVQDLIAQDNILGAFALLNKSIAIASAKKNEVILFEGRHSKRIKDKRDGLLTQEVFDTNLTQLGNDLLGFLDTLVDADVTKLARGGSPIHERHSLTCDRIDQNDGFETALGQQTTSKCRFFYVFGDKMQSHESLVQRFKYEKIGQFLSSDGTYQTGTKVFFPDSIKPTPSKLPDTFKRNVLRELFARFNLTVNDRQPIEQCSIKELLGSPTITDLGSTDVVFVMFCIDDFTWNKDLMITIVKWFIETFCAATLPDNAPSFCFFFTILYKPGNKVEQEIEAIVEQSSVVAALPKLLKVETMWIEEWFSRHNELEPSDFDQFLTAEFGQQESINMRDIEPVLRRIIDNYNAS